MVRQNILYFDKTIFIWENSVTVNFTSDPVESFDEETWMESYNKSTQKLLIKKRSNIWIE